MRAGDDGMSIQMTVNRPGAQSSRGVYGQEFPTGI